MARPKKYSKRARDHTSNWFQAAVYAAIFVSGGASLILELVWTRQFALVFGTTELALSLVLAAFMAGMALGSFWFGRRSRRWLAPLWQYALLETGIALSAVFLSFAISSFDRLIASYWSLFSQQSFLLESIRFLTAFGMVVVPTTLMGGTLPVLCAAFSSAEESPARPVGRLYAANLAGAVAGAFLAGFLLIPTLGITATAIIAITCSMVAAAIGILAARLSDRQGKGLTSPADAGRIPAASSEFPARLRATVLVCLGLFGVAALLEEVLWFRSLRLVVGSSTYALTVMLLTFLVGLALGSYLMALVAARIRQPAKLLAWLQAATVLSVSAAVYFYPLLPGLFLRSYSALGSGDRVFFVQALVSGLVLLPTTVLLGALFPLSAGVFASGPGRLSSDVGQLYGVLTLGNVVGAVLATTWLGWFGLSGGLLAAAYLQLVSSLLLVWFGGFSARLRSSLSVAAIILLILNPTIRGRWNPQLSTSGVFQNVNSSDEAFTRPEEFFRSLSIFRVLYYAEGKTSTVSVYEEPSLDVARHISLAIDGKVDASTGEDMPTQELLAHLPMLVGTAAGASSEVSSDAVCVIGWGSGITAGSLLRYPVEKVTAIEIEPAVIEASRYFEEFNYKPLSDPRLRLVIEDARAVLLREDHLYQAIISEPSNPWLAGPSKLYTREFLELVKSRLRPGGIFTQWIHLYGLDASLLQMFLRTFGSVYPHVLAFQATAGDLILLGSDAALTMDPARINGWIRRPALGEDLARIRVTNAGDVLRRFRFGERELEDFGGSGPLNTDDLPALEFGAAKAVYKDTLHENQAAVLEAFVSLTPYLAAASLGDAEKIAVAIATRALWRGEEPVARMFARQLQGAPATAQGMWLLGELARREDETALAQGWWLRGLARDPNCRPCAISAALALQQQNHFADAARVIAPFRADSPNDPLLLLLDGINRFYLGNRAGSAATLRGAIASNRLAGEDDFAGIIQQSIFPVDLLATFYLSAAELPEASVAATSSSNERERILNHWRLELLREPGLDSWDRLLSQIEFHSGRAAAAVAEQRLTALVVEEVLEPLVHFHRGVRAAQQGNVAEAQSEFTEAAKRVTDPDGRQYLETAFEKLTGKPLPL